MFTKELVNDLADKLLIGLSEEENKMVLDEFDKIDRQIDLINKIPNIKDAEPMTHALDDFEYQLREDVVEDSITREELLKNCDCYDGEEIIVPKVVG